MEGRIDGRWTDGGMGKWMDGQIAGFIENMHMYSNLVISVNIEDRKSSFSGGVTFWWQLHIIK